MIAEIFLEEPMVVDLTEWGEFVAKIDNASVVESHCFTNPMTGDAVPISSQTEFQVKLNGEIVSRSNLIAIVQSEENVVAAFRLTPTCDTIAFEGDGPECNNVIKSLAEMVDGVIEIQ